MAGCERINLAKHHGKDVTILEMEDRLQVMLPMYYIAILNEMEQLDNLNTELNNMCYPKKGVVCKNRRKKRIFPRIQSFWRVGSPKEAESFRD